MIVSPGASSVSVDVFFADDTGAAVTGKVAADFPACKWSSGSNTADTTITLSDLSLITTAHPNDNTAGGVKEREGGWYRLDLPNNMFTSAGRHTLTFAESAGKRIIAPTFDVQYVQSDIRQTLGTTSAGAAGSVRTDSVTGAVGSVTGAVGSITGVSFPANFASLVIDGTGRVNAFLIGILTSVFTEGAVGRIAAAFKQFFNIAAPAATMDHGILVDTATAAGSVSGAVGSVTGAVGSVAGNVGGSVLGNVSGSVGSVSGAVGSVTGAVGSVAGNVGGNVVGSTGSVSGAVGSVSGNVGGDVSGKVLGGGASALSGDGVRAASVTGAVGSVTGATGSVTSGVNLASTGLDSVLMSDIAAVPGITATLKQALNWIFILFRNKRTQTSNTETVLKDDGTTPVATSAKSDDGTTFSRGKYQ